MNINGTFRARATKALLAQVGKNETPAMQVVFQIQDEGEHQGVTIRWDGWLTDKAQERTIESLQYCGWTGDDISVFAKEDAPMQGMDLNDVEVVVAMEPYEGNDPKYEGKSFARVQWVNRLGGRGLNVENAMPEAKAIAFAEKMKGIVHKARAKNATTTPAAPAALASNGGKPAF